MTACRPTAEPTAAVSATAIARASAPVSTPLAVSTPTAPVTIDEQQIVGRFATDGNEARTVEFKANGRYLMLGGVVWDRIESTWSLEASGTRVRLHHDHQQPEDLLFAVRSPDVLVLLDNDGTPFGTTESTLERLR